MNRPDLDAAQELSQRRINGYASIEHEGQLMDAVPALLAYIRHLESLPPAPAPASPDLLEAARKVVKDWEEDEEGRIQIRHYKALKAALATPRPPEAAPAAQERKWPDEVLYLGKEIAPFTGLLSEYQTAHDEAAGDGGCACKLCKRYDRMRWDLFLPPSENPHHRTMEANRRAAELGLPASPARKEADRG